MPYLNAPGKINGSVASRSLPWRGRICVAGLLLILGTFSAAATETGGTCCQDIERRIDDLSAATASGRQVSLEVSGKLQRSVLYWSDQQESNAYVVDPTSGGSFFTFSGDAEVDSKWGAGFLLEIEVPVNPSDELSQTVASFTPAPAVGAAHFYIAHEDVGTLGLGKQTEAHDHITESDLSATDDFASPSVADWNGGFLLRRRGGGRLPIDGATWSLFGADGIGDGEEANIIRFDTPEERTLQGSLSWGMGGVSAVALRYEETSADFKVMGGAAFAYYAEDSRSPCRDIDELAQCATVAGSISIKHLPSGLSATAAAGFIAINPSSAAGDDHWFYAKLARAWSLTKLGATTTYSEYFYGTRSLEADLDTLGPTGAGIIGLRAETSVFGAGVMQTLDGMDIDFYLSLRRYEIEASTSGPMPQSLPLQPFSAILAGSRITF